MDHEKEWKIWEERIGLIENAAKKVNGVTSEITIPPIANHTPTLNLSWDIKKVKMTRDQFQERLRMGNPSIEVRGGNDNSIVITAFMLQPGQEKIVANRIREELVKASL
jgi:L-seryl-tRNA(Ser) seleniumtransferase